jgi:hypothetical protein
MQSRVHVERVHRIPYGVRATVTRSTERLGEERTLWVRKDCLTEEAAGQLGSELEKCDWADVPRLIRTFLDI